MKRFPGHELVVAGLADLASGRETEASLVVGLASDRLRDAGVDVPAVPPGRTSHRLYLHLAEQHGNAAHSRHGALLARVVSFARAAEHARTDRRARPRARAPRDVSLPAPPRRWSHRGHFDPYSQALAKIERDIAQDREDVANMLASGMIERARLLELFEAIEPELFRYPAIDPPAFRARVARVAAN